MSVRAYIWSNLRNRGWRAAALGVGVLVAATSFVLLTSAARTSSARVHGRLTENFRSAYDLLVRPAGSLLPMERREGLVRDNFLSGLYGGISFAQYRTIASVPGVSVAAPIANIGQVLVSGEVTVPLQRYLGAARNQAFRVAFTWVSNGVARYPAGSSYLFYTRTPPHGQTAQIWLCNGFTAAETTPAGPFAAAEQPQYSCAWPGGGQFSSSDVYLPFQFPVAVAAIDPRAENALLGLRRTLTSGNYLSESGGTAGNVLPVIASSRFYLGDVLLAQVQPLRLPTGVPPVRELETGGCLEQVVPCRDAYQLQPPPGGSLTAYAYLTRAHRGPALTTVRFPPARFYQQALAGLSSGPVEAFWQPGPVTYRRSPVALLPRTVAADPTDEWQDPFNVAQAGWFLPPPQNRDVQYRKVREVVGINNGGSAGVIPTPSIMVVGQFDPRRLPGFSPLSRVPMETYVPPVLEPADAATGRALHGRALRPTQNLGGYIQPPPLLLTSMAGLRLILRQNAFQNLPAAFRRAPIAAVRVRVAGVHGVDALSQARLQAVATLIRQRTGLVAEITAGSSPQRFDVALGPGRFGSPPLLVREGWSKIGAAFSYANAIDRKSALLFALTLAVCLLFVVNGATGVMATRRTEIATLATFGWSRGALFRVLLGEFAAIGAIAGAAGSLLAVALIELLHLRASDALAAAVFPVAILVTVLAAAWPAWRAARRDPVGGLVSPARSSRFGSHARGPAGVAVANLAGTRARTLLGASALAVGVAAGVIVLAIVEGFRGELVTTALGHAITVEIRGVDELSVALTICLAAAGVADAVYLNLRDRSVELATLRAVGWSVGQVRRLVAWEALLIALAGGIVGGAVGAAVAILLLGVPAGTVASAAVIGAAAGIVVTQIAACYPIQRVVALEPAQLLSDE